MSVNEVKLKRLDDAKLFNVKGTGPPTNRTFAIGNEDHTLGNALRHVRKQELLGISQAIARSNFSHPLSFDN